MDLSPKIEEEEVEKFGSKIPVLSEYVTALESHVKLRYLNRGTQRLFSFKCF